MTAGGVDAAIASATKSRAAHLNRIAAI